MHLCESEFFLKFDRRYKYTQLLTSDKFINYYGYQTLYKWYFKYCIMVLFYCV